MHRRTTIADVARHAGVGKVTVSYVLNGRSRTARISDETAERVMKAANELNYRPNAVARMLVTKRTETLAIVFQRGEFFSSWSSFISEVMRGVSAAAVAESYDLMLHTKAAAEPAAEADFLSDGRVDGALILRDEGDPTLSELLERGFPCVQFFTRSDDPTVSFVDADNYAGGRMAAEHLLELGHTHIGMLQGSKKSVASNDRFAGYCDALVERGLRVEIENTVQWTDPSVVPDEFIEMMSRPNRPTALFVWSDDVAHHCLTLLRSMGFSVPEDVSIVGFDSLQSCDRSSPPLTSVRQPIHDMAETATRMLISLTRGEEPCVRQVIFPLSIDVRASTAPPRIAH